MNNLTTRKIVLGLLMALVLVFSVQGIADAVEFGEATGDLQTITEESGLFTITVPVTLGDNDTAIMNAANQLVSDDGRTRIDSSGYKVRDIGGIEYRLIKSNPTGTLVAADTPPLSAAGRAPSARRPYYVDSGGNVFDSNGDDVYVRTGSGTDAIPWLYARATGDPADPVSLADRYHYNEEAIKIDIPSGITLTEPVRSTSDVTLTETADSADSNNLASDTRNIILMGFATSTGKKTIKIIDSTPSSDRPGDAAEMLTFTIYVVRLRKDISSTASIRLAGVTNGVGVGYYGRSAEQIYRGDSSHYPVTYTVYNGIIYAQETVDRQTDDFTDTDGTGDTLVTSSAAQVYMLMGDNTTLVTAQVMGASPNSQTTAVYIYGYPTLDVVSGTLTDDANQNQMGEPGEQIGTAFQAKVTDEKEAPVQGVPVKFDVKNKTGAGGTLVPVTNNNGVLTYTIVDSSNKVIEKPRAGSTLYVRTDDVGLAKINFELGSAPGDQVVEVQAVGSTKTIKASTPSAGSQQLSIHTNQRQPGDSNIFDLIALVEANEIEQEDVTVRFTTTRGSLKNTPRYPEMGTTGNVDENPAVDGKDVDDLTDSRGRAHVIYDLGDYTGGAEVTASIREGNVRREILFSIRGGGSTRPPPTTPTTPTTPATVTPSLTISVTGTGTTRAATVTATNVQGANVPGLAVALSGTALTTPRVATTGTPETVTLPSTAGDYTLLATAPGFTVARVNLTVAAAPQPGTLTIERVGDRIGNQQSIRVTAQTSDGTPHSGDLTVTLTGAVNPPTVTTLNGRVAVIATLPTTTGAHVLTVSATGYGSDSVIIPAVTAQTADTSQTRDTIVGEADSLEIDGQRRRSGTVNEAAPLRVRVLDANDNGVADVRVTFRVLAPGRGRLSDRGNGRATQDQTDRRGYASANLTPSDDGDIIVRANAAGVRDPVTFIIAVGEADDTAPPDTPTPDTGVPRSRDIDPVVHVGAASRPPMLWVDGGAIYALVGADVKEFAPSVDNALNIAVGGGKVYWTEKTGDTGTINSANLNGSDVTELTSILAVPMGIAVDTAGSKLYWTNSRGRIQSANLDGSGITNVIPGGLESPMDLALAGGNGYWTQGNGSVRVGNLTSRVTRDISTGTDTPGSIVIGGSKVYWTEMTGDSSGTINSANLSGTGATQLASILAVPMGIAVDTARSKLYWTNSRGRVQSANLDGSGITNVVDGLGSPGDMVLSNSIAAPAATPTPTTTTPGSNYDVDGSGTVDNVDLFLVALAVGTNNTKYDVNGDGTVDGEDIAAVRENRDEGAAAAPMVIGVKLTADQMDRIQEQIDVLVTTNDRSPAAMRTLIYLQQLLVTARPEKTQLLANYPNPFNPETWIPYELATDTHVRLMIYNTQGVVIRTLQFGHQSAGYYVGRDRAAYWDGRNALGEQVASGLYFYQLETDAMSLMRKMVILK